MSHRDDESGGALGALVGGAYRLMARPVRGLAGSDAIDMPRRLEEAVVEAAASPAAERALDRILAGPLPEKLGRSLGEHRVVERIVGEAVAATDVDEAVASALESEQTARVLERVTQRLLASPEFERMLEQVFTSPQVRRALAAQSVSFAAETAGAARARAVRVDEVAERAPRRWLRRPPRPPQPAASPAAPYGGIATRGVALVVDSALLALVFLIGSSLVALVSSLVGHLRPVWLVGILAGVAWLLLLAVYFIGFWTTAGQTPGMRLMRLRVRGPANALPGVGRSLVRLVGLALAIIPCFAGFLPVLVDDRRRGLHDFLAGTVVVYEEPAEEAID